MQFLSRMMKGKKIGNEYSSRLRLEGNVESIYVTGLSKARKYSAWKGKNANTKHGIVMPHQQAAKQ